MGTLLGVGGKEDARVPYLDDERETGFLYPFVRHQQGDKSSVKGFTPKDLTDYETCVPRDDCSQIVVGGVPTDGYELHFG